MANPAEPCPNNFSDPTGPLNHHLSADDVLQRMAAGHKPSAEEIALYADYVENQRLKGESDFKRWSKNNVFAPQWDERTAALREMVPEFVKSIVDFGCGAMALRAMLPPGVKYIPLDIVTRSPDTVVADLNAPDLPVLPRTNAAFFSGALEYVIDLDRLLDAVSNTYHIVVCSYAGINNIPDLVSARRRSGWVNDLKVSEFMALFEKRGYLLLEMKLFGPHSLFLFRRRTIPVMAKARDVTKDLGTA